MQVNRLNLVFPPGSANPTGTAAASPDALQAESGKAQAATNKVAVASAPAPQEPAAPAASGVTLELGSAQKAAASGVYTRAGTLAGRTAAAADQTPAEHFVASAVNILRDFDANTMTISSKPAAEEAAPALPTSRFGSLRQAMGKLNVFA
jgi:hypothetical protein